MGAGTGLLSRAACRTEEGQAQALIFSAHAALAPPYSLLAPPLPRPHAILAQSLSLPAS